MPSFARTQNRSHQSSLSGPAPACQAKPGQRRHSVPQGQQTHADPAIRAAAPHDSKLMEDGSSYATPRRFAWDISRISMYPPLAIQTKLVVNQPGDRYEQEADRIAEQVLRAPGPVATPPATTSAPMGPQRQCACGGTCSKCEGDQPDRGHPLELLHRKPADSENASPTSVPPVVAEALRMPGRPLDPETRGSFEARFGHSFADVRIHDDAIGSTSAHSVHAQAYAVGNHLVFADGKYSPGTLSGKRLLAHELTHVLQQRQGTEPAPHVSQPSPATVVAPRAQSGAGTLMRAPASGPSAPPPSPRMSDAQLESRSIEIFEQAVGNYLKATGKDKSNPPLGTFKKELTVAVYQGVKDGQVVTLVAGQDPKFQEYIQQVLRPGEELIEPVSVVPDNLRTGEPRKSGHVLVHSEQLTAAEAHARGYTDGRVATSNKGCGPLCISNLSENYPGTIHVNPSAKAHEHAVPNKPVVTKAPAKPPPIPAAALKPKRTAGSAQGDHDSVKPASAADAAKSSSPAPASVVAEPSALFDSYPGSVFEEQAVTGGNSTPPVTAASPASATTSAPSAVADPAPLFDSHPGSILNEPAAAGGTPAPPVTATSPTTAPNPGATNPGAPAVAPFDPEFLFGHAPAQTATTHPEGTQINPESLGSSPAGVTNVAGVSSAQLGEELAQHPAPEASLGEGAMAGILGGLSGYLNAKTQAYIENTFIQARWQERLPEIQGAVERSKASIQRLLPEVANHRKTIYANIQMQIVYLYTIHQMRGGQMWWDWSFTDVEFTWLTISTSDINTKDPPKTELRDLGMWKSEPFTYSVPLVTPPPTPAERKLMQSMFGVFSERGAAGPQ